MQVASIPKLESWTLVTYCIRWFPSTEAERVMADKSSLGLVDGIVYPLGIYTFWQLAYLIKTEWVDREKLNNDENISTSFRYLQKMYRNSPLYAAANVFGPRFLLPMFVLMQLLYTMMTIVPTLWMYQNCTVHTIYICCK